MTGGVLHAINTRLIVTRISGFGRSNDTEATTLSLHIYGTHPNFTERSQYDVGKKTEMPFKVAVVQHEEAS